MRDKQIEMHELAKQMSEAISTAVEQRYIEDEAKLEAVLRANGWRKVTDVAREIFERLHAHIKYDGHTGAVWKNDLLCIAKEYGIDLEIYESEGEG